MASTLVFAVFWLSVAGIIHTYLLFPLLLSSIAGIKRRSLGEKHMDDAVVSVPDITILIAAYNEEKNIRERIENLAQCQYPIGKMSVLVGSDGSTDATNAILAELSLKYDWLDVVVFAENRGKTPVVNSLIAKVRTPITVLTDADTIFSTDALVSIVQPFRDLGVGCVAGVRRVRNQAVESVTSLQESSYLDLDNRIRVAEGELGCIIGAHGSLYAIRTELLERIPEDRPFTDDFFLSMIPLERDFRVMQADRALSFAEAAASPMKDFMRKVRYSSTAFATCFRFGHLLWSSRPLVAYCFFSHRVSRWFLPFFLVIAVITNVALLGTGFVYSVALAIQALFYLGAVIGILIPSTVARSRVFSLSAYFVYSNAALFVGFFRWISGRASHRWVPSRN